MVLVTTLKCVDKGDGVDDGNAVAWAMVGPYHGRDVMQGVGYGDNDYDGINSVVVE